MARSLVSVIIPTYNRADEVCRAVESVLNQTYQHIEIIVVDDGSTDDTFARLPAYEPRVTTLWQANKGPSAARNLGIARSHGDIIMFLDSDDLWLPQKAQRQVELFERSDEDIPCCICNAIMRDRLGGIRLSFDLAKIKPSCEEGIWHNVTRVLSTRCLFFTQAAAIRREAIEKAHGFDTALDIMEDYDLAVKLSLAGPWGFMREPLVVYNRDSRNSLAGQARRNQLRLHESIERILLNILADDRIDAAKGREYFKQWLNKNRQQIHMLLGQKDNAWTATAMNVIRRHYMRIEEAVFRRSPWFPAMEFTPA